MYYLPIIIFQTLLNRLTFSNSERSLIFFKFHMMFLIRDIKAGEILAIEKPLVVGPIQVK